MKLFNSCIANLLVLKTLSQNKYIVDVGNTKVLIRNNVLPMFTKHDLVIGKRYWSKITLSQESFTIEEIAGSTNANLFSVFKIKGVLRNGCLYPLETPTIGYKVSIADVTLNQDIRTYVGNLSCMLVQDGITKYEPNLEIQGIV